MESPVTSSNSPGPLRVFVSYAHDDIELKRKFEKNLTVLREQKLIEFWTDSELTGGDHWSAEIELALQQADLILFLVSTSFLASKFIREKEVPMAMAKVAVGSAVIVPVILRKTPGWLQEEWNALQALPNQVVPVEDWATPERGFVEVEEGLRKLIPLVPAKLAKQRQQLPRERTAAEQTPAAAPPPSSVNRPTKPSRMPLLAAVIAVILAAVIGILVRTPGQQTPIRPAELVTEAPQVAVLSKKGEPVEKCRIPACRTTQPTAWTDVHGQQHPTEKAIEFDIQVQSKDGPISGPVDVEYFIRTSTEPARERMVIDGTIASAFRDVKDPDWKARGYTSRSAWTLISANDPPLHGAKDLSPHPMTAQIICGPNGYIPDGALQVGVNIVRGQEVLYTGELTLDVFELDPIDTSAAISTVNPPAPADGGQVFNAYQVPDQTYQTAGGYKVLSHGIAFQVAVKNLTSQPLAAPLQFEYYLPAVLSNESGAPGDALVMDASEARSGTIGQPHGFIVCASSQPAIGSQPLPPGGTVTMDAGFFAGKQGLVPIGEHEIGFAVKSAGTTVYRQTLTLQVQPPLPAQ